VKEHETFFQKNFAKESFLVRFEQFLDPTVTSTAGGQQQLVAAIHWSPDGQVLVVAFQNGLLYFLDVQTVFYC
jgi:hypothetical protein